MAENGTMNALEVNMATEQGLGVADASTARSRGTSNPTVRREKGSQHEEEATSNEELAIQYAEACGMCQIRSA